MASIIYANLDDKQIMKDFIKRCPTVVAMNMETKNRVNLHIEMLGD